jgi:hypothetical protein
LSKSKISRRTYASTSGTDSRITVFKDDNDLSTGTNSSSASRIVESAGNPIVFNGITAPPHGTDASTGLKELIVIRESGDIECLDGDTLEERWTSPASALEGTTDELGGQRVVEFAALTSSYSVAQGIFKESQNIFTAFSQDISEDGYNPDVLVLVSRQKSPGSSFARWIHIVAFPRITLGQALGSKHSVHVLLAAQLPAGSAHRSQNSAHFALHALGGTLHQLHDNKLTTFTLTELGAKIQSNMSVRESHSFLRLSSTSIMVSSKAKLNVYNPKYQSLLSTVDLSIIQENETLKRKRETDPEGDNVSIGNSYLASYFPKLSTAVALVGNNIVAIQIEGNKDRKGGSSATGLLIDSLGCAMPGQKRNAEKQLNAKISDSVTITGHLPGTVNADGPSTKSVRKLEAAVTAGDVEQFDKIMAEKAIRPILGSDKKVSSEMFKRAALGIDRRWILYSLRKIFQWNNTANGGEPRLFVSFYAPATFLWLIQSGHMTISNIRAAFQGDPAIFDCEIDASDLISAVYDINPDMDLLFGLIRYNHLDAIGLVEIIRILIDSFELLGGKPDAQPSLLTNGEGSLDDDEDMDAEIEELEAEAEEYLNLAEYQLETGSGVRGQALSLALSKLYACPTNSIVNALQTKLSSREIVCLIYLLRFDLQKGGWTAKYLDAYAQEEATDVAEVPDNAIILISTLLGNCIDAIGAGGWLAGDAMLVRGDGSSDAEDLISALKLEVSAALESIEEGTYLKGITSEMVRYGNAVQMALKEQPHHESSANKKRKPVTLKLIDPEQMILPVGLKAEQQISRQRVGAGGEVQARTARDIGHLKSQKVGKYTFERITI